MSIAFIKKVLHENEPLFRLMHHYNSLPSEYLHESRFLEVVDSDIPWQMRDKRRMKKALSRKILKHYGLKQSFCYDFEKLSSRFLLLDKVTVEKIVRLLGLAVHSGPIARVIFKQQKQRICQMMSESEYEFTLKKAPLMLHSSFMAGELVALEQLEDEITVRGKKIFEMSLAGEDEALTRRFSLKFPEHDVWCYSSTVSSEEQQYVGWVIGTILKTEFTDQWKHILL